MAETDVQGESLPPGLAREWARAGRWLFRWRSYVPLVVLAYLAGVVWTDPLPYDDGAGLVTAAGLVLGAVGLIVRGWAVGYVRRGTSGRGTRAIAAEALNTDGLYSVVRHPLYLGNFFIWMGVAALTGRASAVLVTALFFWVYYERIMFAEEQFLATRFGDAFEAWCGRTPAFVPAPRRWRPPALGFSLRFALARDYQAVYGFVATATVLQVVRSAASGAGGRIGAAWVGFFAAGTLYYLAVHLLRTRTRVLQVPGR